MINVCEEGEVLGLRVKVPPGRRDLPWPHAKKSQQASRLCHGTLNRKRKKSHLQ
jgi:hypothetical protein